MARWVEDSGSDLCNQLRSNSNEFESICLAQNNSNDTSDTAELWIVIQGITESSEVKKLASP
jgi:hypothetical protein